MQIKIDTEKCKKDKICIIECPFNILRENSDGFPEVIPEAKDLCMHCGHCLAVCPSDALTFDGVAPESCEPALNEVAVDVPAMEALLKNGADTVILLDPNVMGLTAKHFRELILPGYREMTGRITTPLILHICGDTTRILEDIPSSGFAAFSFDYPSTALEDVTGKLGETMGVIGSVPTVSHLLNGTREDVIEVSEKMIKGGVDLLASSCFTPPQTPKENLLAMGEAIDGLS